MRAFMWVVAIWLMLVIGVRLAHCEFVPFTEFDTKLIHFNNTWNKFFRQHFNCPKDAADWAECRPQSSTSIDYSGFVHVANEGFHLFAPVELEKEKQK
jgi:hypothetical protein